MWNGIPQALRKSPKCISKKNIQNRLLQVLMEEDDHVGASSLNVKCIMHKKDLSNRYSYSLIIYLFIYLYILLILLVCLSTEYLMCKYIYLFLYLCNTRN